MSFLLIRRIARPSGFCDQLAPPSALLAAARKVLMRVDKTRFFAIPQADSPIARFTIRSSPALRIA